MILHSEAAATQCGWLCFFAAAALKLNSSATSVHEHSDISRPCCDCFFTFLRLHGDRSRPWFCRVLCALCFEGQASRPRGEGQEDGREAAASSGCLLTLAAPGPRPGEGLRQTQQASFDLLFMFSGTSEDIL